MRRTRETQGVLSIPGLEESDLEESAEEEGMESGLAGRIGPAAEPEIQPLPYRIVVASWPDDWRERWGRRANALEEAGLSWRDAEGQAFVEVWSQFAAEPVDRN